jgi:hypothetical protein
LGFDPGQQAHHAPGKGFALESRSVGKVWQTRLHGLREKSIGEGIAAVCANAQAPCKLEAEPPLHAPALHHDHFGRKG